MNTPQKECIVCGSEFFNLRFNKLGQRIRKYTKEKWKTARFCSHSCRNVVTKNRLGHTNKNVGYSGLHKWVRRHLGKRPLICEVCGEIGVENGRNWSIHYANIDGRYKRRLKDWLRLCTRCHRRHDKKLRNGCV